MQMRITIYPNPEVERPPGFPVAHDEFGQVIVPTIVKNMPPPPSTPPPTTPRGVRRLSFGDTDADAPPNNLDP